MAWWNEEPDIGLRAAPDDFPDILAVWREVIDHPDVIDWEDRTGEVFSPAVLIDIDTLVQMRTNALSVSANAAGSADGGIPRHQRDAMAAVIATLVARSLQPEHQTCEGVRLAMGNLILRRRWFGGPDADVLTWLDAWCAVESTAGGWFAGSGLPPA